MRMHSILSNTLISSGARLFGSALAFLSFALIARRLGIGGLGVYATALAVSYTFAALADLGLYNLLVREISQNQKDSEESIVSRFFTLRLVALFVSLFVSVFLVFTLPLSYSFEFKIAVVLAGGMFFSLSLSQLLMAVFQKYLHLEKAALAELCGRGFQFLLTAFFFVTHGGLYGFVSAALFGSVLIFVLNAIFARRYVPFRVRLEPSLWPHIIRTAFPIGASLVFTLVYFKMDTILLSLLAGEASVGLYNLAYKFLESVIFFPAMFVGILMPFLSRFAKESLDSFTRVFQATFDLLALIATPLLVGGVLLALPLVEILGGEAFTQSAMVLRWLLVAIWFIFLGNLFGNAVVALDKQKQALWVYFGGMIFNITANILIIPRFAHNGAAATTAFTEILISFMLFFLVYRATHYVPNVAVLAKSILASALMGGLIFLLRGHPLFVTVPLGIAVYFSVLLLLKGITREHLGLLTRSSGINGETPL